MSSTSSTRKTRTKRANTLDTLTVALVGRQSRSDDGSLSVPDQMNTMGSDVDRRGWVVGNRYSETDVSGQRPLSRRTGLLRAVEDVEAGRAQVVMVAYFDRLCRSLKTQIEVVDRVEAAGGIIQVAHGSTISHATPTDRLTSTMLGAVAEYVALTAGERTVVSKQRNIDKGVPPFPKITPAYVRREDGTLEPHPTNAPLVREAIAMRTRKTPASFVEIARWLNEQPLVTTDEDGNECTLRITPSGVKSMLGSKLLIGEIHFGDFTPNLHAGASWGGTITDRVTFRKMQSLRASRGRYAQSDRLLARQSVLRCKTCDARMTVTYMGSDGKKYAYYICGDKLCTRRALVSADVAEQTVVERAIEIALKLKAAGSATNEDEIEQARLARDVAETTLANAIKTLIGLDSETATREVLDELTAERDAAVDRHERLLAFTTPDLTVTAADWPDLSLDARREIIRIVIDRAVVTPGRGPGRVHVIERTA
jgi:DNA invertase Pin-like site-specific DNA recombinase